MVLFCPHLSRLCSLNYAWRSFHLGKFFCIFLLLFSFIAFIAISRYVNIPLQYFLKDYFTDFDLVPSLMGSGPVYWMCTGQKSQLQTFKQCDLVQTASQQWYLAGQGPGISEEIANGSGPHTCGEFISMENGAIPCVAVAVWLDSPAQSTLHLLPLGDACNSFWARITDLGLEFISAALPSPLLFPKQFLVSLLLFRDMGIWV